MLTLMWDPGSVGAGCRGVGGGRHAQHPVGQMLFYPVPETGVNAQSTTCETTYLDCCLCVEVGDKTAGSH